MARGKVKNGQKSPWGQCVTNRKTQVLWHQSEARTAATVWNWSGKTLHVPRGSSRRSLLFFVPYFSARLDFPSPPLSAPGSPRIPRTYKSVFLYTEESFIFANISVSVI